VSSQGVKLGLLPSEISLLSTIIKDVTDFLDDTSGLFPSRNAVFMAEGLEIIIVGIRTKPEQIRKRLAVCLVYKPRLHELPVKVGYYT
jgi:hypothetical protein